MHHRIAAVALAAAIAAAPALAHEPFDPPTIGIEQARLDLAGVARNYAIARGIAVRLIQTSEPLLADDLGDAIEYGDKALADSAKARSAENIEVFVYRLYGVVAHIVNSQPLPSKT